MPKAELKYTLFTKLADKGRLPSGSVEPSEEEVLEDEAEAASIPPVAVSASYCTSESDDLTLVGLRLTLPIREAEICNKETDIRNKKMEVPGMHLHLRILELEKSSLMTPLNVQSTSPSVSVLTQLNISH